LLCHFYTDIYIAASGKRGFDFVVQIFRNRERVRVSLGSQKTAILSCKWHLCSFFFSRGPLMSQLGWVSAASQRRNYRSGIFENEELRDRATLPV
jgi:hypothetical protein